MANEELAKILEQSKLYWSTGCCEGEIADLRDANLCGANLRNADLRDANLCGADLCNADLGNANLCGADLCGADLGGANLCGADLCGANLGNATLCGANLYNANLCDANLGNANLCDANLCNANLGSANLCGANLRNADLGGGQNPIDISIFGVTSTDVTLPLRVAKAVLEPDAINMASWHTCDTTHCLAGWAVHLSGSAGYTLQDLTSPSVAGCMLMPSASHLFYSNNKQAIEWAKSVVAEAEGLIE